MLQTHVERTKALNPAYEYALYDDADMDAFVNREYGGPIAAAYNKLNIAVAKADFWRYLVLYKYGGVYLDMDSHFIKPLDELIRPDDEAILTFENNHHGFLVQWGLIFRPTHPILKRTIERIVSNIETNRHPNNIHAMTGPQVFTEAFYDELSRYKIQVSQGMNTRIQTPDYSFRLIGFDYDGHMSFSHHEVKTSMYANKMHWLDEQKQKPLLKKSLPTGSLDSVG